MIRKRRFLRIAVVSALLGMSCISMSGCTKRMTEDELIAKVDEEVDGRSITYAECEFEIATSYTMRGEGFEESTDLEMLMDMEMWTNMDPMRTYMEGTVDVKLSDQEVSMKMQTYGEQNGDMLTSYAYSDSIGEWVHTEEEFDFEEYEKQLEEAARPMAGRFEDVTLQKELEEEDDKEVYVLEINSTGDEIGATMKEFGNMLDSVGYGDLSMDDVKVSMLYYVDKETFLPIRIEMEVENMQEMLNEIMEGQLAGSEETAALFEGVEIEYGETTCRIVMDDISYEEQDVPTVPEEVKQSLLVEEALQGIEYKIEDGKYVLKKDGRAIKVETPDGYGYDLFDENRNMFGVMSSDISITISYCLTDAEAYAETEELIRQDVADGLAEMSTISTPLGEGSAYVVDEEEALVGMAFIPLEDDVFYVHYMDIEHGTADVVGALTEILNGVGEFTIDDIE